MIGPSTSGGLLPERAARRIAVARASNLLSIWVAAGTATLVLVAGGVGHRILAGRIGSALREGVGTKIPLAGLPIRLGDWDGEDVPLDPRVLQAANFDDDYINRAYVRKGGSHTVTVFVGYVGRPRAALGHRPDVCYSAHGWQQLNQEQIPVATSGGAEIPSILYEFRSTGDFGNSMLVLATYIMNGRFVRDPQECGAWNSRSAQLLGERPAFLARVQVAMMSSADRSADIAVLREFVGLIAEPVVAILPYGDE